jgi:hypothetical protein
LEVEEQQKKKEMQTLIQRQRRNHHRFIITTTSTKERNSMSWAEFGRSKFALVVPGFLIKKMRSTSRNTSALSVRPLTTTLQNYFQFATVNPTIDNSKLGLQVEFQEALDLEIGIAYVSSNAIPQHKIHPLDSSAAPANPSVKGNSVDSVALLILK